MKNALIRLLALATLATSVSAFAATGDSKRDETANASDAKQQQGCADSNAGQGKKQKNEKKQKEKKVHEETQEEKDFDRLLMGTYG